MVALSVTMVTDGGDPMFDRSAAEGQPRRPGHAAEAAASVGQDLDTSASGDPPGFSVLMPAYNVEGFIAEALDSVLAQSRAPSEIIVVDDASTDRTPEILERYRGRITMLRQERSGSGVARNRAAAAASGEYLVMLDADDILLPWALETVASHVVEHARPTVVMSRWRKFTDAGSLPQSPSEVKARSWPDLLASSAVRKPLTMASAVRADAFRRVSGFVPGAHSSEDIDLWLRLGTAPGFLYLDGGPLYGYRQRAGSTTQTARRLEHGIGRLVDEERRGRYPGGARRARERRRILTRNVVWGVKRCWSLGDHGAGTRLFFASLALFSDAEALAEAATLGPAWARWALRSLRGRAPTRPGADS